MLSLALPPCPLSLEPASRLIDPDRVWPVRVAFRVMSIAAWLLRLRQWRCWRPCRAGCARRTSRSRRPHGHADRCDWRRRVPECAGRASSARGGVRRRWDGVAAASRASHAHVGFTRREINRVGRPGGSQTALAGLGWAWWCPTASLEWAEVPGTQSQGLCGSWYAPICMLSILGNV